MPPNKRTDRVFVPENRETSKILELFWEEDSPFCSFNPSDFEVEEDGKVIKFSCSEQYFMYKKSLFVNDNKSAESVLKQTNPGTMKYIGRKLNMTKSDLEGWSVASRDVMYRACLEKFSQNQYHRILLFRTRDMVLVEASPYDKIWGIGLDKDDPRAKDPATWQGTNWLGEVLDRVRDELWENSRFRYQKAQLAADDDISVQILVEVHPKNMKTLGRRLRMSKKHLEEWSSMSRDVMYRACLEKFSQNEVHRLQLFRTHGMQLVEASPTDKIWGIGES